MHNFLISLFNLLKNIFYSIKVITVFFMMALLLYWINNTAHFEWSWFKFLSPVLDNLLHIANIVCPFSFKLLEVDFELKYVSGIVILLVIAILMNLLIMGVNAIQVFYLGTRALLRKSEEVALNKLLKSEMKRNQKRKNVFHVVINTYPKEISKYAQNLKIDMDEQNKILSDYLLEKFKKAPIKFEDGFMYTFENFESVDDVLMVLFKVINSKAPISYTICLQISTGNLAEDKKLLTNLVRLRLIGSIYSVSDTAYRYSYNYRKNFVTAQVGVFQEDNGTIEVHEFKNI